MNGRTHSASKKSLTDEDVGKFINFNDNHGTHRNVEVAKQTCPRGDCLWDWIGSAHEARYTLERHMSYHSFMEEKEGIKQAIAAHTPLDLGKLGVVLTEFPELILDEEETDMPLESWVYPHNMPSRLEFAEDDGTILWKVKLLNSAEFDVDADF